MPTSMLNLFLTREQRACFSMDDLVSALSTRCYDRHGHRRCVLESYRACNTTVLVRPGWAGSAHSTHRWRLVSVLAPNEADRLEVISIDDSCTHVPAEDDSADGGVEARPTGEVDKSTRADQHGLGSVEEARSREPVCTRTSVQEMRRVSFSAAWRSRRQFGGRGIGGSPGALSHARPRDLRFARRRVPDLHSGLNFGHFIVLCCRCLVVIFRGGHISSFTDILIGPLLRGSGLSSISPEGRVSMPSAGSSSAVTSVQESTVEITSRLSAAVDATDTTTTRTALASADPHSVLKILSCDFDGS